MGLFREKYSCVALLPAGLFDVHVASELLQMHRRGVKLYIVTDCEDTYARFDVGFHLELYLVKGMKFRFALSFDGVLPKFVQKILVKLDKNSSFNYAQFVLEHSDVGADVMVKAGAGTGKTTAMVTRISYLIYRHELDAHTLPDWIWMFTFTRGAAALMQEKLSQYFQAYFELTRDEAALAMARAVDRMGIGTIHALARRILNVEVVCTKAIKESFLLQALDKHDKPELCGVFTELMEQLSQKNIDPADPRLNWGKPSCPEFHTMMLDVLKRASEGIHSHLAKSRQAGLDELVPMALKSKQGLRLDSAPPHYVFIDEFQDTDDNQIALIHELKSILGFKLFVVGDVKQCIYRFRGATAQAFDILAPSKQGWSIHHLTKNYRTDIELLDALNRHFTLWGARGLLPYKKKDRLAGVHNFNIPRPVTQIDEPVDSALLRLLQRLDCNDIAILTRKNHQAQQVKENLADAGITDITILTIHKAKGLEFDTVILPFIPNIFKEKPLKGDVQIITCENYIGYHIEIDNISHTNNNFHTFRKQDAKERACEEARILYVATTRARRRLIHFGEL